MSCLIETKNESTWNKSLANNSWFAQVNIRWNNSHPTNWDWLNDWEEVWSAWYTLGSWNMSLWVKVSSPDALENFVNNKLKPLEWIDTTYSSWNRELTSLDWKKELFSYGCISIKWNRKPDTWNWLTEWDNVISVWSTMGEWDMNLWVKCNSISELQKFIDSRLNTLDWVKSTNTTLIQEVYHRW